MDCVHLNQALEGRQIIVETAHVLLAAGSHASYSVDVGIYCSEPLDFVFLSIDQIHQYNQVYGFPYITYCRNQLQLLADLVKLMSKYKVNFIWCLDLEIHMIIIRKGALLSQMFELIKHMPEYVEKYYEMMESLGDIFGYFLLVSSDIFTAEYWDKHIDEDLFMHAFVQIAGYASQPGHSKKLMRMILKALNANNVNKLRRVLPGHEHALLAFSEEYSAELVSTLRNNALEWVMTVQTPLSLQELTSRVIIRTMSHRCQDGVPTLGLPVHLISYVLNAFY